MQIKKINNNQLKVILSSYDLNQKNIDVDSFLASSIESQDLFFEILDLAEEQYDFHIENSKAMIEAISLENNLFILTITKLKNVINHFSFPSVYCLHSIDDFFAFYSSFKNEFEKKNVFLYEFQGQYYLICSNEIEYLQHILLEYASPLASPILKDFLLEHGKKIK